MKRRSLIIIIAALAGCAVVVPVASGSGSKHKLVVKKVKVVDNYFAPTKLTIKKGNAVNFVWASTNYNTHNVTLVKGPKGVRKPAFTSIDGTIGIHFQKTFTKPGTYHFECTLHPDMNITVVVKG